MAVLLPGGSLPQEVPLRSANGAYFLVVQADGNLVGYTSCHFHRTNSFWASGTQHKGVAPFRLVMQLDGNLVLYDANNNPTWSAATHGREGSGAHDRLVIQDDRNIVLYRDGHIVRWATNTHLA